ncbi:MAG: hypothetical protein ACI9WS_002316 [Paraglaciecola psychrophila]
MAVLAFLAVLAVLAKAKTGSFKVNSNLGLIRVNNQKNPFTCAKH